MSGDGFDVEEFLDELGVRQEVQDLIDIDNAAAIRGGGDSACAEQKSVHKLSKTERSKKHFIKKKDRRNKRFVRKLKKKNLVKARAVNPNIIKNKATSQSNTSNLDIISTPELEVEQLTTALPSPFHDTPELDQQSTHSLPSPLKYTPIVSHSSDTLQEGGKDSGCSDEPFGDLYAQRSRDGPWTNRLGGGASTILTNFDQLYQFGELLTN